MKTRALRRLLFGGCILVATAVIARFTITSSQWYRERLLKNLSTEDLTYAIHDSPNDWLTLLYYGNASYRAGNLPAAESALRRAGELNTKEPRVHKGLGSVHLRSGKLEMALAEFRLAEKLDSKDTETQLGISQTLFALGSHTAAIDPLRKIVELEPKNADAWYNLGKLYGEAHLSDRALDAMERAVALAPGKADYHRDLGQLYKHYSRLPEAEKQYSAALKADTHDPVTYYWLGQLYSQMGTDPRLTGKAEAAFVQAIVRDPRMPEAYFELGLIYERRRIWEMAITQFEKARSLDPSDEKSLLHLGQCWISAGDPAKGKPLVAASKQLEEAKRDIKNLENRVKSDNKDVSLRMRLAKLYEKFGNEEGAYRQYLLVKHLGSTDSEVPKRLEALKLQLLRQGVPESAIPVLPPNIP